MSIQRAFGLGLLALVASASAQNKVPWKLVKSGPNCKATNFSKRVIRTAEEFDEYWSKTQGTVLPPKGLDWSKSVVIAINLGHRGSRMYSVSIRSVVQDGDEMIVKWVETAPSPKMLERNQAASPYVLVSIPPPSGRVVFRGEVEQQGRQFADENAFPIKKLVSGGHCRVKDESSEVIEDEAAFANVWTNAFGTNSPAPRLDFGKNRYVAIFLGQCPTPGYEIVVQRIARIGKKEVQVMYTSTKPAKGAIEPQMVTNPFVFLVIPKSEDALTVERVE